MCSHREGEASTPRALGREQKYEMTRSLYRWALLWGELLTESSLLKKLNANDIPRYIQTSRIPNSGDGVKCPKMHRAGAPYGTHCERREKLEAVVE